MAVMEEVEGAIVLDGLDSAIMWVCSRFGEDSVVAYDYDKVIEVLMECDGMAHGEAIEFFDFNIGGLYAGPRKPVFIRKCSTLEEE